jgi:hypothetical protein
VGQFGFQQTIRDKIRTGSAATSQRFNVYSLQLKPSLLLYVCVLESLAGRCAPSSDFVFAIRPSFSAELENWTKFSNNPTTPDAAASCGRKHLNAESGLAPALCKESVWKKLNQ